MSGGTLVHAAVSNCEGPWLEWGKTMRKRRVVVVLVILLVLVLLIPAGYLSTAMSMSRCYRAVAQVVSHDLTQGQYFYLEVDADEAAARAAFDSVGARYSLLPADPSGELRFPRLRIWTDRTTPFTVSIKYLF
jgi:hypothetical protein